MANDIINHPDHYTAGGIEVIDFIEAKGAELPSRERGQVHSPGRQKSPRKRSRRPQKSGVVP
jgi:hypothetical protein